ncbi:HNH endonuclease [Pseudomonas sp. NPDC086112]|uniref:HNH endonuclease n=1 Tax=Pseudomonas TaxID=286 RepID=UPI001C48AAE8|nr:HNH endonuclease [Pseudomonas sp. PDM24]
MGECGHSGSGSRDNAVEKWSEGTTTIQLVKTAAHEATLPHRGSVAQYEKHESTESVLAASKKCWLANKIPKPKPGRCS